MAGGSIFRTLLGVLTFEEIMDLAEISSGKGRVYLSDKLLQEIGISTFDEVKQEVSAVEESKNEDIITEYEERAEVSDEKKEEVLKGVLFILDSWRKTKSSKKRLKEKEILDLYESCSQFSSTTDSTGQKMIMGTAVRGLLVNKKQY